MPPSIPHHVNPSLQSQVATAPYNFVPLPQDVYQVDKGLPVNGVQLKPWEHHDAFLPGTHSGWIDLRIQALTPIFIRGAARQDLRTGKWEESLESNQRSAPFLDHLDRPTIPGSSLRGLIRNIVEIISFSKIQPVSEKQPFFRSMTPGRISDVYRSWFIDDLGEITSGFEVDTGKKVTARCNGYRSMVRAGIVRINGSQRWIEEFDFARIERTELESAFGTSALVSVVRTRTPNWAIQHQPCFVSVDPTARDYFFRRQVNRYGRQRHPDLYLRFRKVQRISRSMFPGAVSGTVVISGDIVNKHLEFVVLTDAPLATIPIPHVLWDRFHDDDQISQWQEKAFPAGTSVRGTRGHQGHLCDGDLVFFICDSGLFDAENPNGLKFFGRAQMFRFPYDTTPADLVPAHLRTAGLDLTEVMFGVAETKSGQPSAAIKGRVFFEDCPLSTAGDWLAPEMTPEILAAPKVTAYQQYLTQDGTEGPKNHTTYINGDRTTIRGHKLYWHRWDNSSGLQQVENRTPNVSDTQTTRIRPIKTRNSDGQQDEFTGRIRFENLTEIELGALLSALNLPSSCAHKIGLAKPLGLGSIRITATLHCVDRSTRYSTWDKSGVSTGGESRFVIAFADEMTKHASRTNEAMIGANQGLRAIARLDALFQLLEWDQRPDPTATKYLILDDFKNKYVLPSPHRVRVPNQPEPMWPEDTPRPGDRLDQPRTRGVSPNQQTSWPRPPAPPKPQGKTGKFKERVTVIKLMKQNRARVKLVTDSELDCEGVNAGMQLNVNDTFLADVEYVDGKPTRAKFRSKG